MAGVVGGTNDSGTDVRNSKYTDHQTIRRASSHDAARMHNQNESAVRTGHNIDKDSIRVNALKDEAEKPFSVKELVTGSREDTYMKNVGKEGLKKQQENMGNTGRSQ
jgi:hypothetical protein